MANAIKRSIGLVPAAIAGVFKQLGSPTAPPQRFETISQSSYDFGLIAHFAPIIEPRPTMTGAATKSGGHGIRSASSTTHSRNGFSNRTLASNLSTGCNAAWIGFGSGQGSPVFLALLCFEPALPYLLPYSALPILERISRLTPSRIPLQES